MENSRCADVKDVVAGLSRCPIENVYSGFTDFDETWVAVQDNSQREDLIVIFGSFFLVSEFLSKRSVEEVPDG